MEQTRRNAQLDWRRRLAHALGRSASSVWLAHPLLSLIRVVLDQLEAGDRVRSDHTLRQSSCLLLHHFTKRRLHHLLIEFLDKVFLKSVWIDSVIAVNSTDEWRWISTADLSDIPRLISFAAPALALGLGSTEETSFFRCTRLADLTRFDALWCLSLTATANAA